MSDMLVDNDPMSPTYGDVVYDNTKATVTSSQAESVAQRLSILCKTFKGEWFINTDNGVPYYQEIFGKVRNKQTIDLIFQQKILEEPDVVELTEFFSDVSNGRTYTINFRVRTTLGQITNNIQVNAGA